MCGYKILKTKVPLNYGGFQPVVIPTLAYDFLSRAAAQLNLFWATRP
jgi:hypothetical protein